MITTKIPVRELALVVLLGLAAMVTEGSSGIGIRVTANGGPAAGTTVLLQCPGDDGPAVAAEGTTDEHGQAVLERPSGAPVGCRVWAGAYAGAGFSWVDFTVGPVPIDLGPELVVTLRLRCGTTSRELTEVDPMVHAILHTGEGGSRLVVPPSLIPVAFDPRHHLWRIAGLPLVPRGRMNLTLEVPGFVPRTLRDVPLSRSGTRDLGTLELWPAAVVSGSVTGPGRDEPVTVRLTSSRTGEERRIRLEAPGPFRFKDVPAGVRHDLLASSLHGESPAIIVLPPESGVVLELPYPRRLEGEVVDAATGTPLPEVTLILHPADGPEDSSLSRWFTLDQPDGGFSVDVPSDLEMVARFEAEEHAPVELVVPEGESLSGVFVELGPAAAVGGLVLEQASGVPVEGAIVDVECTGIGAGSTTSDESGEFLVEGLPAGSCRLTAHARGFAPASGRVDLEAGEVLRGVELLLDPAATISGYTVNGDTGVVIAGVRVEALNIEEPAGTPGVVTSGADGSFRIGDLAPGLYAIHASKDGFSPVVRTVRAGPAEGSVVLELHRGVTVEGTVLGALGDGGGLLVTIQNGSRIVTGRTSRGGSFRLEGVPEGGVAYTVMGGTEAPGLCSGSMVVPVGSGNFRHDLDCTGGTVTVAGTVTVPSGQPASGLALVLDGMEYEVRSYHATADESGTFRFEGIRRGTYSLLARPGKAGPVTLWSGDAETDLLLDLVLPIVP